MPIISLSPSIPVPLTPALGGTGVANTGTSFHFSGSPTINDTAGTFSVTGGASGSSIAIGVGKSPIIQESITFAGTDSTTMTFPSSSTTVAGLSITETFTAPQTITTNTNAAQSLQVGNSGLTTGAFGLVYVTTSTMQSSNAHIWLHHDTSTFSSVALYMDMASGSGTFSGDFIDCVNAGTTKFIVASNGQIISNALAASVGTSIDLSGAGSSGTMGFVKSAACMESAVSTGTITIKSRTSSSSNNSGWLQFVDHGGTVRYIPYV